MSFTDQPGRSALIAEAIDKPVRRYRQCDAWPNGAAGTGGPVVPDADGDWMCGGSVWELRNGYAPVRVSFDPDVPLADVSRLLRKIADWIDRYPDLFEDSGDCAAVEAGADPF